MRHAESLPTSIEGQHAADDGPWLKKATCTALRTAHVNALLSKSSEALRRRGRLSLWCTLPLSLYRTRPSLTMRCMRGRVMAVAAAP